MFAALAISAVLLAAASPGAAPPAASADKPGETPAETGRTVSEAVVTAKPKDDPMKVVCHNVTPVGSRLPVKRCEAAGDAAMRRLDDRQQLERMQGDTYRR